MAIGPAYSTGRLLDTPPQHSKSNFGVVWPWNLTSWPPRVGISFRCPLDHLCQFADKSVDSFSKYRSNKIGNKRPDGQTEGKTGERSGREHSIYLTPNLWNCPFYELSNEAARFVKWAVSQIGCNIYSGRDIKIYRNYYNDPRIKFNDKQRLSRSLRHCHCT